jgi:hypothetical protein
MRSLVIAVLVLAAAATHARADEEAPAVKGRPVDKGTLGVGIILGEPVGICAKLYLKDDQAVQVAAGSDFLSGGLQIDADYVFHPWILQDRDTFVLPVYVGPGVRFIEYNDKPSHFAGGLRGVIGMVFDFKSVPLDAFIEIAGVLEYGSGGHGAGIGLNAGAGVRYYF